MQFIFLNQFPNFTLYTLEKGNAYDGRISKEMCFSWCTFLNLQVKNSKLQQGRQAYMPSSLSSMVIAQPAFLLIKTLHSIYIFRPCEIWLLVENGKDE